MIKTKKEEYLNNKIAIMCHNNNKLLIETNIKKF